jgi:hypothetical protein
MQALGEMGADVLHGVLSTFVAVVVMAGRGLLSGLVVWFVL